MAISFYKDIYNMLSKKHPNSKIYVIGDHHFDHKNIIGYTRKNFENIDSMNDYIINKHNQKVNPNDIVIFLGDLGFNKINLYDHILRMNGYKYLLLGNHDNQKNIKFYYSIGFEKVFIYPIKIKDNYFSHEPLKDEEKDDFHFHLLTREFKKAQNKINYHGHIHEQTDFDSRYKNSSCESLNYSPFFIGYTGNNNQTDEKERFINSPYFNVVLEYLSKKYNLDPTLLITDYIYSSILEINSVNYNHFFTNGSFALYKKYGYISKFSDLDVTVLHGNDSKTRSLKKLREFANTSFEYLNQINEINLSFKKIYDNICIFNIFYNNQNYNIHGHLDANMLHYNFYKDSDFLVKEYKTTIEEYLIKNMGIISEYHFPFFKSQLLVPDGDIANYILQILFQNGFEHKKELALKKIKYIYNNIKNKDTFNHFEDFEDIFTRYFLRNIAFLYTVNRSKDIDYIKNNLLTNIDIPPCLPLELKNVLSYIIYDSSSDFNKIYKEFCYTSISDVLKNNKEEISKIKVKK